MAKRKAPKEPSEEMEPLSEAWNKLAWRKLEKHCFRIQKRIDRASQRGNKRAVQKLQKLLMKSQAARLVAVRKVTPDNQGKKTAGIDGVKSVKPQARFTMMQQIHPKYWRHQKPKPVRRVWIPKPGKAEKRPLGRPTMLERAKQALVKAGLEPEWEAVFEANSSGFRPGRSGHDAIAAILNHIRYKPKFVLDADIKGGFDNIKQGVLLVKLQTSSTVRRVIKSWLKAGVLEGGVFSPTEAGTPQGGGVSPLLANIALHGMETAVKGNRKEREQPVLIRYADDFLVLHPQKEVLEEATQAVTTWLKEMGLILSPSKTKSTHPLTPQEATVGFEFLGFTLRQFPVGKTNTGKDTQGRPLGCKTIIRPSQTAIKQHVAELGKKMRELRGAPQEKLIKELNPIIRGWATYYRTVVAAEAYRHCDNVVYHHLVKWAQWRHPDKNAQWRSKKYWRTIANQKWVFAASETMTITRHGRTQVVHPYAKVRGTASPYDGNLLYWSQRLKNHPMLRGKLVRLLQKQQGKCRWCELLFREGDLIEIDHLDGNHANDEPSNQVALHRHCHDERHTKPREEWIHAAGVNHK
jgi:RNA-directed DNA polymerase